MKTNYLTNSLALFLLTSALILTLGCEKKGPAERTGSRMDEVIDNVKEGENPMKHKGTMEKMGESIDDIGKDKNND